MSARMHIELRQLRFRGYHGLYPEEQKIGNEFEVELSLSFDPGNSVLSALDATIDYGAVYEMVKEQMAEREDLLETWLMKLAEKLHTRFPNIKKTDITITKLQVPITGFSGRCGVRFVKEY
ncbi:MAG: dihydroneopterin aldolase [Chitinophagaceae bacterium]|nr:dihydroneopterin aldolase [Chitinophagaceae bacterium]